MTKMYDLPDLKQLKEWKAYDQKGYEALMSCLSKNKKILILAAKNSGKNTFQHAIVNFIHRTHNETLVVPPIEGFHFDKFKSHKKWKETKALCKNQKSFIVAFQHNGNYETPISEYVDDFSGWFDCILDFRNFEGQRVLCAIYTGKHSFKCIYEHKYVKDYLIAA